MNARNPRSTGRARIGHSLGSEAAMGEELVIWEGGPSHAKDLAFHAACLLGAFLLFPIALLVWRVLETRAQHYVVTTERIRVVGGVLDPRLVELPLAQIGDARVEQGALLRLFGVADLAISPTDADAAPLVLQAIPRARLVHDNVRACIAKERSERQ
jgi:uncharacterized membrane protein YdbT with pleckstrin-like domain